MLQYNIHGYCVDSAEPVGDPGTTFVICTGAHFKYHTLLPHEEMMQEFRMKKKWSKYAKWLFLDAEEKGRLRKRLRWKRRRRLRRMLRRRKRLALPEEVISSSESMPSLVSSSVE